jgi:hypothetical protein
MAKLANAADLNSIQELAEADLDSLGREIESKKPLKPELFGLRLRRFVHHVGTKLCPGSVAAIHEQRPPD